MTPADDHPTAAEWRLRQDGLPDHVKLVLARRAAADEAARLLEQERRDAADAAHRAGFERAVADALAAGGHGWLAAYRMADTRLLPAFDRHTDSFVADFDPRPFGLHGVRLELRYAAGEWAVAPNGHEALRPSRTHRCPDLDAAVAAAGEYDPNGF